MFGTHHVWGVLPIAVGGMESRKQKRGKRKVAMPSVVGVPSRIISKNMRGARGLDGICDHRIAIHCRGAEVAD